MGSPLPHYIKRVFLLHPIQEVTPVTWLPRPAHLSHMTSFKHHYLYPSLLAVDMGGWAGTVYHVTRVSIIKNINSLREFYFFLIPRSNMIHLWVKQTPKAVPK